MSYATVWLNGQFVGGWPYGYASWRVDLTPFVKFGADNVLAIRLDNPPDSSRWYPGGGIYRNVWLVKTAPVHVAHWGTYVTTPEVSAEAATVKIQVSVDNDADAAAAVTVKNEIFELESRRRAEAGRWRRSPPTAVRIAAGQSATSESQIKLPIPNSGALKNRNATSWSPRSSRTARLVDRYETPFGIRTIEFTADKRISAERQARAAQRRLRPSRPRRAGRGHQHPRAGTAVGILKEMGCNAIRTSHNPPAPELLDLCDRLGMVVMDEAFDCWEQRQEARTIIICSSTTGTSRTCARNCAATATIRA